MKKELLAQAVQALEALFAKSAGWRNSGSAGPVPSCPSVQPETPSVGRDATRADDLAQQACVALDAQRQAFGGGAGGGTR